jgi:hypothetical protein
MTATEDKLGRSDSREKGLGNVARRRGRDCRFHRAESEPQPRSKQNRPSCKHGAKAGTTDRFHAEVMQLHRRELWLSGLTGLDARDKVILQPTPDPKEGEVVLLLKTQTQLAKEPQRRLCIFTPADLPAQVEQSIGFIARDGCVRTEQFIDYFKGTATAALRRGAID